MKKIVLLVFTLSLLVGCKKRDSQIRPIVDISKASLTEQREFVSTNLKVVATEIAKAIKDPEVKQLIESEAAKQFDGDYNVLIKTLLKYPKFRNKVNITRLHSALDAFKNIGGENYFPQIYIPRLSVDNIPNKVSEIDDSTRFVIYDGDETKTSFPAYEIDGADSLILAGYDIDEYNATTLNVFVISTNESVDNTGSIPNNTHTNNQTDSTPPPPYISVQINKMTVLQHKESWAAGKSDVHMRAWLYTYNGLYNGNVPPILVYGSDRSTSNFLGCLIKKFTRNEIKNQTQITLNYNLQNIFQSYYPFSTPIIYYFVIFEKDNWPADVRVVGTPPMWVHNPNENQQFLQFRSADGEYWLESFYSTFNGSTHLPVVTNYLSNPDNIYTDKILTELKRKENASYQGIRFNVNRY